jgi:hypothetical protein
MKISEATLQDAVTAYHGFRKRSFEDARAAFAAKALVNPSCAVTNARSVLEMQHEYDCWDRALSAVVGGRFSSAAEAMEYTIDTLQDSLLRSIGGGESTCRLSNADHLAQQCGTKRALPDLKALLKDYAAA